MDDRLKKVMREMKESKPKLITESQEVRDFPGISHGYNDNVRGITGRRWKDVEHLDWTDYYPLVDDRGIVRAVIDGSDADMVRRQYRIIFDTEDGVYREAPDWEIDRRRPDMDIWVAHFKDYMLQVWYDDTQTGVEPSWVFRVNKNYRAIEEDIAEDKEDAMRRAEQWIEMS